MTAKESVVSNFPRVKAYYHNCGMGSSYWTVENDGHVLAKVYCGAMTDVRVWEEANFNLQDRSIDNASLISFSASDECGHEEPREANA